MINIIYEDKNLVALNKPVGVNFDWVLSEHPNFLPVHRLDKETSGVIIFAKNTEFQDYIKKLFKDRAIEKCYQALVVGVMRQSSGTIDLPIGRSAVNPLKRVAHGKQRGAKKGDGGLRQRRGGKRERLFGQSDPESRGAMGSQNR